jgi:hypothetical protein
VCCGSFVFTVKLREASPGLLHVEKIEEWAMRNKLHQEILQKSSNFLIQRKIQNIYIYNGNRPNKRGAEP